MEHIDRDVGNERLGDLLGTVVREEQSVRIGRDRTGVGRELVVPPLVARAETMRQPWLDRLWVAIRDSREQVEGVLEEPGRGLAIRSSFRRATTPFARFIADSFPAGSPV